MIRNELVTKRLPYGNAKETRGRLRAGRELDYKLKCQSVLNSQSKDLSAGVCCEPASVDLADLGGSLVFYRTVSVKQPLQCLDNECLLSNGLRLR
jgi:hypothetical protein